MLPNFQLMFVAQIGISINHWFASGPSILEETSFAIPFRCHTVICQTLQIALIFKAKIIESMINFHAKILCIRFILYQIKSKRMKIYLFHDTQLQWFGRNSSLTFTTHILAIRICHTIRQNNTVRHFKLNFSQTNTGKGNKNIQSFFNGKTEKN